MIDGGLSDQLAAAMAQRGLQYATPATIPYIQHSAYLHDALQQMRATGGQNLKSPLALGSNLLAEALDQFNARRADAALLAHERSDQGTYDQNLLGLAQTLGAVGPGGTAPGGMTGAPAAPAAPGPASSLNPTGGAPGVGAAAGGNVGLAQALAGGAPAPTPAGPMGGPGAPSPMAGPGAPISAEQVAALQSNPAAFFGLPGATITSGARSPSHNAQVGGVPTSEHIPGNGYAYDFVPPHGMSNQDAIRQILGSGVPFDQVIQEGNHVHIGWRPAGMPERGQVLGMPPGSFQVAQNAQASPFTQSSGTDANSSSATGAQLPPTPRPVQLATGPDPSIPSPQAQGPVGASPFAVSNSGSSSPVGPVNSAAPAAGGAGAAASYHAPPTGPGATPQEAQMIQTYLASPYPQLRAQGEALLQKVMERKLTPADPKTPFWNAQTGQYQALPGMADQVRPDLSTPDALVTQNAGTGAIASVRRPGGIVDGRIYNPMTGAYDPVPGLQHTQDGGFAPGTVVDRDPSGKASVVQAPMTTPDTVFAAQKDYTGGTAYQEALKATTAYNTVLRILSQSTGNNGMVNMATFDNLLKAETGLSAKQGGMQMLLEHGGVPNEVQGFFGNLTGTGFVPLSQLQQGVGILHSYALGNQQAAQRELAQRNALLGQLSHGAYKDIGVTVPTIDTMPNIPWFNGAAGVNGANGNGAGSGGGGVPGAGGAGGNSAGGGGLAQPQGGAAGLRARAAAHALTAQDRAYLQAVANGAR